MTKRTNEGTRLTDITKRTRGSFERLLSGRLWIEPPAEIAEKLDEIDEQRKPNLTRKRRQKTSSKSKNLSELYVHADLTLVISHFVQVYHWQH